MRLILLTTGVTLAGASPWGPGNWRGKPHGWPKPSVYTPPAPAPNWPYKTTVETSIVVPTTVAGPISGYPTTTTTAPSSSTSASSSGPPPNACASISKLQASYTASAGAPATATVPAALAWECITSVPFNSSAAVALMDAIRPYIEWQTTLNYVKDPPQEYAEKVQPPYDFWQTYEGIYEKAKANGYENERAFGWELYKSFQGAHDGHFVYYPDSVNLIFSFGRTTPLVSISKDGEQIPEVYVFADILASSFGNSTFEPSPLREIDGQDSTAWLEKFSQYGSLQDRDALWNNMFYLLAQVSLGSDGSGLGTFAGGGRGRWVYPGSHTTLTFANGTSVTNENFASVLVPFDGIQNGEDIYQTYFVPPPPENAQQLAVQSSSASLSSSFSASSSSASSSSLSTTIPAPGYPSPVIREPNNLNSGYFLEGEGYDDVAVLSVPSFVGSDEDEVPFQIVNTAFLNQAVAEGKKKLIIDVSANGGGTILQYDLFKQLFPQILPDGFTRYRAHTAFDLIGEEVSVYTGRYPRTLNATDAEIASSSWNYRTDADINYEPFTSWDEKYGPQPFGPGPDNYTSIMRWNLSDPLTTLNSGGVYVSGYLERANITQQPFEASNIVVVYDGYCASTCTIFSELLRQQAGVKTIALGGRPNKDIIQAVGGVKGTNSYPWTYTLYGVEQPFLLRTLHDASYYNDTVLGQYTDLPLYRATNYVVNARDGIRRGDETQTPLQFVWEAADCRIYYTAAMALDQTATWKTIADTAFGDISHCVAGTYGGKFDSDKLKRSTRHLHSVRRDLSIVEHHQAMAETWTGRGSIVLGGDGYMPL